MHHNGSARKVKPRAAGLQRYEEHRRVILVETLHPFHPLALGRGAGDGEMRQPPPVKLVGQHRKIARELREHEHLAIGLLSLGHQLHDGAELLGAAPVVLEHEGRVQRDLAQAREFGEHLHRALLGLGQVPAPVRPRGVLALLGVQILAQPLLGPIVEAPLLVT